MSSNFYTLITGASEGFGKALAIECAVRKMNLILVALPGSGLQALAALIKDRYGVDARYIEKDLCKDQSSFELFKEVNDANLRVNMLINNAGAGSTVLFEEGSIAMYENQIKLNVLATTMITRLFIETLKHNTPSFILNVGSMASFFFLPKKQVYGATKSFIYFFSKSLRKELKKDRVNVSIVCPGGMNTNPALIIMNKEGNWLSRISVMDPEDVAPIAINGLLKGKEVIIPGRINKAFMLVNKLLPEALINIITNRGMKKLNSAKAPGNHKPEKDLALPSAHETP